MIAREHGRISRCRGSGLLSTITGAAGTVLNRAIDLLPVELHLPGGYQYCGPGTHLQKRLRRGDPGINKLDAACKQHDIAYSKFKDNNSRTIADKILIDRAWERVKASDSSLGEKAAAWAVTNIMKAKTKFGGGGKKKNKRKSVKTKNKKQKKRQKKGKGLYLRPYSGSGNKTKKKKISYSSKIIDAIPNKALSNFEILKYVKILRIPYFRGIFMRDSLPNRVHENESAIVNLDSFKGRGTHWVCYRKRGFYVEYFDSFGNLRPPLELQYYFNSGPYRAIVNYNYFPRQEVNTINCGHLCLDFLAIKK